MGVLEDLAAIDADASLTPAQQAAARAARRASAVVDAVLAFGALPQSWSFSKSGATYTITITSVTASGAHVTIAGTLLRNGVTVRRYADGTPLWPVILTNPALLTPDAAGTVDKGARGTFRLDPRGVMQGDLASAFLARLG